MVGTVAANSLVKSISLVLVGDKATQVQRMWEISSITLEHAEDRRQKPDWLLDQCRHRPSLLYRPEIICAWMVAIATFDGDDPAVDHIGCGVVNDIKAGLKKARDGREAASERRTCSQWSITLFLTMFLNASFVNGDFRRSSG